MIRYTLAEAGTGSIILAGLGESLADEHFKKDVMRKIDEAKEVFLADLENFERRLKRDLDILNEKLLADASAAWKGAEVAFEVTLQTNTTAATTKAQAKAEMAINSLEAASIKKKDDLL
ncbi:MAG: hypothetical protein ACRD9W_24750, partial [Terriglobia bacterium]